MSIRFNSAQLLADFDAFRRRQHISLHKAATRADIQPNMIRGIRSGKIQDITVTSMARMLEYMGVYDITPYIYDDKGETQK